MIIFPIIIVLSIVFWLYYKVAILRTDDELTRKYFNAKSRFCLGSLLFFFSINQYIFYQTQLALFIGIVLLFFGVLHLYTSFKEARHYKKEWRRLNE